MLLGYRAGDDKLIQVPLDFVGLNYYTRWLVSDNPAGNGVPGLNTTAVWGAGPHEKTDNGWDIDPQGFYDILVRMSKVTGSLPIEITESGAAYNNRLVGGHVVDDKRIQYMRDYLRALSQAIKDGVLVRGYHAWSMLDNFEWAEGYAQRFGLTYVDFADDQKRTPKASFDWYASLAATNKFT